MSPCLMFKKKKKPCLNGKEVLKKILFRKKNGNGGEETSARTGLSSKYIKNKSGLKYGKSKLVGVGAVCGWKIKRRHQG